MIADITFYYGLTDVSSPPPQPSEMTEADDNVRWLICCFITSSQSNITPTLPRLRTTSTGCMTLRGVDSVGVKVHHKPLTSPVAINTGRTVQPVKRAVMSPVTQSPSGLSLPPTLYPIMINTCYPDTVCSIVTTPLRSPRDNLH